MGTRPNLFEFLAFDAPALDSSDLTKFTNAVAPETYDDDPGASLFGLDGDPPLGIVARDTGYDHTSFTRVFGETYDDDPAH